MDFPALLASLAGTASVTYLGYLYFRYNVHQRDCKQRELLTALEAGQPLPDADVTRAVTIGFIGTLVPLVAFISAIVGSWLVLDRSFMSLQYVVLIVIWGVSGLVSLVAVKTSLALLFRRQPALDNRPRRTPENSDLNGSRPVGQPELDTRYREPERIS